MKQFSVVIGNPPYRDPNAKAKNYKLWHKFVNKAFELVSTGGCISLITPSTIVGETGYGKTMLELASKQWHLDIIDYTADRYFGVGVSICRWQIIDCQYKGQTIVLDNHGTTVIDLRKGMPKSGDEILVSSILTKIAKSRHPRIPLRMGQSIAKSDYTEDGLFEVYASGQKIKRTNIHPNTGTGLKFIAPFSSSHTKRFASKGYVGMLNCWCSVDPKTAERYMAIFDNPLIDYFIRHYKRNSGFTYAVKNAAIPDFDPTSDICSEFDLTEPEIAYLNSIGVEVLS